MKLFQRTGTRAQAEANQTSDELCDVCSGTSFDKGVVKAAVGRTDADRQYQRCLKCSMVRLAPVAGAASLPNRSPGRRLGTDSAPGRDFVMALLGAEILDRADLRAAIWYPGVSNDPPRIRSIPVVSTLMMVGDVEGGSGAAVPPENVEAQSHDLVICDEVIQFFDSPREQLSRVFASVDDEGLAIFSTDVFDGADLRKSAFARAVGHRHMWSPDALTRVAHDAGHVIDFRLPEVAAVKKYVRKRYVLTSPSHTTMSKVRLWFGGHRYAPSEALS